MALCFVSRQAEYLKSICVLIDAHQHNSAGIIARSMIEGLALLLFASDNQTLPERWRAFAAIENLALLKKKEASGDYIPSESRSAIEEQVKLFGERFYRRKAGELQKKGKALPANPFHPNWYGGIRISDVFTKARGGKLYDWIYWETSRLAHWTIGGLTKDIGGDSNTFEYTHQSETVAATSLAVGFQALQESLALLDRRLNLGFAGKIDELRQKHLAIQGT